MCNCKSDLPRLKREVDEAYNERSEKWVIIENLDILKAALNMRVADEKLKMIESKIQEIEETLKAAGQATAKNEPSKLISALDKLSKTLTTNI